MLGKLLILFSVISSSLCQKTNTKAASPYTNCGCQCSSLTFRQNGRVHGNCYSPDETGADWCYVDDAYSSTCQDKVLSQRHKYQNKYWSYEACATPSCDFGSNSNYQNPPVVCKHAGCGNTGSYTGGNTGGFGGNTGSYTGGNTGSYTGGNTGSYTGGNTGSYTGGNTGSYTGGNTGNYGGSLGGILGAGSSNCRGTKCGSSGGYGSSGGSSQPFGGLFGGSSSGSSGGFVGSSGGSGFNQPRQTGSSTNTRSNTKDSVKFGK